MKTDLLTVVTFQPGIDNDLPARSTQAINLLQRAYAENGQGIYVFPEYYLAHLYPDQRRTASLGEPIPGPSTEPFLDFAAKTNTYVIVGLLEQSSDRARPYNTAAVLGPGGVVGRYRKTHLWDLGPEKQPYRECKLFRPGQELCPFRIFGWSVGVMICADGLFPECPRTLVLKGARLIVYPNSRESVGPEVEAATIANAAPIAVSNPVGFNGVDQCRGTSRIVGPCGEVVARVEAGQEGWAAARFDAGRISELQARRCQLRLRRPELYGTLVDQRALI